MIDYRINISYFKSKADVVNTTKDYILGGINLPYYKNKILDNKKEDSKTEKKRKKEEKEDLLTPNKIQTRIKTLFNFKKMKIVCFNPINTNLKMDNFKDYI